MFALCVYLHHLKIIFIFIFVLIIFFNVDAKTGNQKQQHRLVSSKTESTADSICQNEKKGDPDYSQSEGKSKRTLVEKASQTNLDTIIEGDEEDKIDTSKKQSTTGSSLIKKSFLSTKSTRVFTPSVQKSKDKGFEVDEKGLLKITGLNDNLNKKCTKLLTKLFEKMSKRFKTTPIMDTVTHIKTLHNMYLQHYNKHFQQSGEFNDDTSVIIFPQIVKFMVNNNCIQGKFLTFLADKNILDPEQIKEAYKVQTDLETLQKLSEKYSLETNNQEKTVEDKKIDLSVEEKAGITINLAKTLISSLATSTDILAFKNKNAVLK